MKRAADCHDETGRRLILIYELLDAHFGNLNWWPGDSAFEVIVGAILTQNTAWRNVEAAVDRLKAAGLLSAEALLAVDEETLALLIRPAGYYNVKARRLKTFVHFFLEHHGGSIEDMFAGDLSTLRNRLLQINGIGEETADSILLYAGNKPVFVVDAYTRRILQRHGLVSESFTYGEVQNLFMTYLPPEAGFYNQYHALLVNAGKRFCGKQPRCEPCPLRPLYEQTVAAQERR